MKQKIAIISRPGDCFPNIISIGLADMLKQIKADAEIFYNGIPFLMRMLPLSKKPKHWHNNYQFRIRNKIRNWNSDRKLLKALRQFDLIVLSECMPNAYWKNYLDIETLRRKSGIPIVSYTDAYIDNVPIHHAKWFDDEDYGASRYDMNFFPSEVTEKRTLSNTRARAIGINISRSELKPVAKKEFIAVLDFAHEEFESFRYVQLRVLESLGIKTIVLKGRYPIAEIRKIYQQASVFFIAFPETFGLPISECLASGAYIFTPNSAWPMAWRLNDDPKPWDSGILPECFKVYNDEADLTDQLRRLIREYDLAKTPFQVFEEYIKHYYHFYYGNVPALEDSLKSLL